MAKRANSQTSIESIGFGAPVYAFPNLDVTNLPKPVKFSISKLDPEGSAPPGEYLYSCIALLIYCEKHGKVAICYHERSESAWLPFAAAPVNKTWVDATQDIVNGIFSKEESEGMEITPSKPRIEIKSMHTVHILRIQLPVTLKYIYRLTQLVQFVGANEKNCVCFQPTNRLKWIGLAEAKSGNVNNLFGPEVALFAQWIPVLKHQEVCEFSLEQAYRNISPQEQNSSNEFLFIAALGHAKLEKVYRDFLEFCFPSFYMTFTAFNKYFREYMSEMNQNDETMLQLFNGFNSACNGYLSFHEFWFGLVFIDPVWVDFRPNENRLKFIFRYYDKDQDQKLNEKEVIELAQDLRLENLNAFRQQMGSKSLLKYSDFFNLAEQGHLPNVELLCLSQSSIISKISENVGDREERRLASSKRTDTSLQEASSNRNLCLACRPKKYSYGSHCVRMDPSGRCVEPRRLPGWDAEKLHEISLAKYSQDYVFSTVSIGHIFLDMIREFNACKGTSSSKYYGFLATPRHRQPLLQYLKVLCQNVISLFECEDRLIKINSPAYVIGDICGNLEDLLTIGQILWREVPVVANNYVFLGNYVNVGQWGIECVLVLFALKIIAPNKFFFIRGTNEIREAQNDRNGLRIECLDKYGLDYGQEVWNAVNEVFDRLSLAVIIDESVLCLNNSVPHHSTAVENIFNVPANLKNPMSDPVAKTMFGKSLTDELSVEFLKRNELSHLIRSNLSLPEGYHFSGAEKIISTSNRQHSGDELTVICVDRPKIRVVKLDTSK